MVGHAVIANELILNTYLIPACEARDRSVRAPSAQAARWISHAVVGVRRRGHSPHSSSGRRSVARGTLRIFETSFKPRPWRRSAMAGRRSNSFFGFSQCFAAPCFLRTPAITRFGIKGRSNSAKAPIICRSSQPVGVVPSTSASCSEAKPIPAACELVDHAQQVGEAVPQPFELSHRHHIEEPGLVVSEHRSEGGSRGAWMAPRRSVVRFHQDGGPT